MPATTNAAQTNILIGMPSHRGIVTMPTLISLMDLQQVLLSLQLQSTFVNVDAAEITYSRNSIANRVFDEREFTHLLFIDDDMSFDARLILDLLKSDKAIVGAICPKRTIDLEKFYEIAASGGSYDQARAEAATFVARFPSNKSVQITDGWVPLEGIGMGITLIQRIVLEKMVEAGAVPDMWQASERPHAATGASPFRYGFFDSLYDDTLKTMLSEDLSFCKRWRTHCGGEIWGNANYEIGHIGQMIYSGKYIDRLMMGKV
ncbi:MAG: hypothetical protein K2P80_14675 [Beijerinckiaceae bacterium]|nr:hypothetical protein [Beijerinckiaceae bacterium]